MSASTEVCPAAHSATLPGRDVAAGGAHPGDPVAVDDEAGDLAVLDEVDARPRRRRRAKPQAT